MNYIQDNSNRHQITNKKTPELKAKSSKCSQEDLILATANCLAQMDDEHFPMIDSPQPKGIVYLCLWWFGNSCLTVKNWVYGNKLIQLFGDGGNVLIVDQKFYNLFFNMIVLQIFKSQL